MEFKQVRFIAPDVDTIESTKDELGGIAVYEYDKLKYVICGCCGGYFEPDDVKILRVYEWLPISDEIKGE